MSGMRVKHHPTLGILVREDGCVYLPKSGPNKAHWTYGCNIGNGYMVVGIARKNYLVHRVVVEAFIQYPIPQGMEVDHINRNPSDNWLENLRIVSRSANQRNTSLHDRVDARGGTHKYEDVRQYWCEKANRYYPAKRQTHRRVLFSDGSKHWIPNEEAEALLKMPVRDRHFIQ